MGRGKVFASCGHEIINYPEDEIVIEYADWVSDKDPINGGMEKALVTGTFCKKCSKQKWLKKAVKEGLELKKKWQL